jgi:hypothetical protein
MNETDSLDVLSDSYIIAENISVFKRAVHEGAPVQLVSSKESVKWRKLGLVYYSISKQRYYLTEYSAMLLRRVLDEGI